MAEVHIEVAPKSIPLSNTGCVPLDVRSKNTNILLGVGASIVITPGEYAVLAKGVVIANICYYPEKFEVIPTKNKDPCGQFGVYVNLLDLSLNPMNQ